MSGALRADGVATAEHSALDRGTSLILFALVTTALVFVAMRLREVSGVVHLNYNEGWNAYHALRFVETGSPYPPQGGLVINNYPPLWFPLIALVGMATDSLISAGRIVATAGFLLLVAGCAAIGGQLRGRKGAVAAAATITLMFATQSWRYIGIADPQMLAQGVSVVGLVLCVRAKSAGDRWYLGGVAVAVLAGFIKHNLAALPIALLLGAQLEGRTALWRSLLAATTAVVAGYLLGALVGGVAWPVHLISPRSYYYGRLVNGTISFVSANIMGIVLAVAGLMTLPGGRVQRVLGAYLVLSVLFSVFFSGGDGVAINIFFDPAVAVALGAALLVGTRSGRMRIEPVDAPRRTLPQWTNAALLGCWLLSGALYRMRDVVHDTLNPEPPRNRAALFRDDVQFLKALPGAAICDSPDLCFRAGKEFIYDQFNTGQSYITGKLSSERVRELLRAQNVQIIHTASAALDDAAIPPSIAAEVASEFELVRENENGAFFVRRGKSAIR